MIAKEMRCSLLIILVGLVAFKCATILTSSLLLSSSEVEAAQPQGTNNSSPAPSFLDIIKEFMVSHQVTPAT
ncbi:hypothetical protein O3M35_008416 [Rhynocoris fuscipes]|uniref:Uncharacterized protein n=1 Tax=Rhynocoris fuscipes TaxID=488301 RepID=A0AAW1DD59_9HEMI